INQSSCFISHQRPVRYGWALVLEDDKVVNSMENIQIENSQNWQQQNLSLAQYVHLRNGVPLGDAKSLPNMLYRSLGATSFAAFWQYWNPIWGYGLGKYVYAPLRQVLPSVAAYLITFVVSGGIHDLATMAIRRSFAFLFTPWFFVLGVGAVLGRALSMDLSNRPWWIRASVNHIYLVSSLVVVLFIKQMGALPWAWALSSK
ncbi:MAG: hypothetical protein WBL25_01610, partial [Anaerolineales bacterium]